MKMQLAVTLCLVMALALATEATDDLARHRVPRVVVRRGPSLHPNPGSPPRVSTRIVGGVNAQIGTVGVLNRPSPDGVGTRAAPIIRAGSQIPARRCLLYNEFNLCIRYI
ncbi:uncharacterized protein LOC122265129 isoform X2 [Penaeus japonicus]|nr:uncharacterized protein LOC122265129 isoform X2 [Penaeus japonicus]